MDRIEKYFKNLRFDENHHLGLGDIRITFAQQEQVLSLCKAAMSELKDHGQAIEDRYEARLKEKDKEIALLKIALDISKELVVSLKEDGDG